MCLCFILFLTQKLHDKKTVSDNVTQGVTRLSSVTINLQLSFTESLGSFISSRGEKGG